MILESEVDCDDEGVFSHRLLFWPRDELTIDFTDLSLEIADREDRRVDLAGSSWRFSLRMRTSSLPSRADEGLAAAASQEEDEPFQVVGRVRTTVNA